MTKTDIGSKIQLIAQATESSILKMGNAMGIKNPTMQSYINDGVEPKTGFIKKLIEIYPNLNLRWFFFDEGNMFLDNSENQAIEAALNELRLYRRLEAAPSTEEVTMLKEAVKAKDETINALREQISLLKRDSVLEATLQNMHLMLATIENKVSKVASVKR